MCIDTVMMCLGWGDSCFTQASFMVLHNLSLALAIPTPGSTFNPQTPTYCLSAALSPKHCLLKCPSTSPLNLPLNQWPKQRLSPSCPMAIQCPSHAPHCSVLPYWTLLPTLPACQPSPSESSSNGPAPLGVWGGRFRSLAPSYLGPV